MQRWLVGDIGGLGHHASIKMSLASRARHPKRPTPNRKTPVPWDRKPINLTRMAQVNEEVIAARRQTWRPTSGAFGKQAA